jgi:tetratricopeptide (TPR) repeat protein
MTAAMIARGVLVLVMLSATAQASIWDHALASREDAVAAKEYDDRMGDGDAAALICTLQSTSVRTTLEALKRAEAAYRAAAAARPREAEPYFRIGNLLHQMHFDCELQSGRPATCDRLYATPSRAEVVIEAWDEFERRAPLDPRVGDILLKRAILSTKAINGGPGDRKHLESAARDYQAALDRSDGLAGQRGEEQLLGNLAETYMMLDRLDDSIATYSRAIAIGAARVSTVYGLAVALDRDGSTDQAFRYIQGQGPGGFDAFSKEYMQHSVFFVPDGESNYYFALVNEAFGRDGAALEYWQRYVASGAHPEFQPRAREHIEQLHKRRVRATEPPPEPDDPNW